MRGERIDCTCLQCGKVFSWLKSQGTRKFCSQACKSAVAERIEMHCPGCGKHFTVLKSQMTPGRAYCSMDCKRGHTHRRKARMCQQCDREFQASHSTSDQRFCSVSCRSAGTPINYLDGRTSHPHYERWYNMVRRCTNRRDPGYPHYGGRGIKVCDEWLDPWVFYRYLDDVLGVCPEAYSLDRIDNNDHYKPGNVRWATKLEQYRNRRPYMVDPSRAGSK